MPSGYTHILQEGAGFKKFAKRCLRAFGASIHMRDEPMDKEVEPATPSTYHKEQLEAEKKELEKAANLSHKAIKKLIIAQWKRDKERAEEYLEKELKVLKNYEDALKEAKAYQPPTPEHENYKKFMIEQIEESIEWDCGSIEQISLMLKDFRKLLILVKLLVKLIAKS